MSLLRYFVFYCGHPPGLRYYFFVFWSQFCFDFLGCRFGRIFDLFLKIGNEQLYPFWQIGPFMAKEMLNTSEVAEYLRITDAQVYKLLKQRRIPGSRITGKWLFFKSVIDEWILEDASAFVGARHRRHAPDHHIVVAGNNDGSLDLLAHIISDRYPDCIFSLSNVGSIAGLLALKSGCCHIAAVPFPDAGGGVYDRSILDGHLSGMQFAALNLVRRAQGLIVQKGNPLSIFSLKHLANKDVAFINQQKDSGTRILLDRLLKENRINSETIRGYSRIAYTQMEAALEIFHGAADAGLGTLAAARAFDLDFIPITTERFDLIIPATSYFSASIKMLRQVLNSEQLKSGLMQMGGYDVRDTGKIVFEKN
jgi:excisionase family DNA binding protein